MITSASQYPTRFAKALHPIHCDTCGGSDFRAKPGEVFAVLPHEAHRAARAGLIAPADAPMPDTRILPESAYQLRGLAAQYVRRAFLCSPDGPTYRHVVTAIRWVPPVLPAEVIRPFEREPGPVTFGPTEVQRALAEERARILRDAQPVPVAPGVPTGFEVAT
jgi:hypothetical protein